MVVASVALLLLGPSAGADPFGGGGPDQGWIADSSIHTYCFGPGFDSNLEFHANYAMGTSLDAATDMSDQFETLCGSATDIRWLDANLSGTIRAMWECKNRSGSTCFAYDVTLDPAQINQGSNDSEDTSKSACHEVGHTVGLEHGATKNDCMRNGEIPDTSQQWRSYNNHHINDHINLTY